MEGTNILRGNDKMASWEPFIEAERIVRTQQKVVIPDFLLLKHHPWPSLETYNEHSLIQVSFLDHKVRAGNTPLIQIIYPAYSEVFEA